MKTNPFRISFVVFIFVLLLPILAACGSTPAPETVYTRVADATLAPGDAIPTPTGKSILTVTGEIGTTNAGDTIEMDLAAVEAAGIVEYTVLTPFQNREIVYRGPLLSDLLALWQVPAEATTLYLVALNDYRVEMPIEMVRDFPVVFALQADGEYMSIADRGPAMLVLPYDDFEFERPASDKYWIWQIKSIEIK